MHTSEIIFMYNNLLHVLATYTAILIEAMERTEVKR